MKLGEILNQMFDSLHLHHIFNHKYYETEENPKYIWCQTCFDLVKIWS